MSRIKGMCLFYDWREPLEMVSASQFKAFILAMMDYHENGTEPPEFKGKTEIAAKFIFPQIKRSRELSGVGKMGGESTAQKRSRGATNGATNGVTDGATDGATDGVTLNKTETKTETKTKTETETKTETRREAIGSVSEPQKVGAVEVERIVRFEKFWNEYPKRVARSTAEKVFYDLDVTDETLDKMLCAIREQLRTVQWQKEDGRYIPNPARWLMDRRWEDEASRSCLPSVVVSSAEKDRELEEWFEAKADRFFGEK